MSIEIVVSQQELSVFGDEKHKLSINVNWGGESKPLWMLFPSSFAKFVNLETYDWALASLLVPAMKVGARLVIIGNVSPRLYRAAKTDLQNIFKIQNTSLRYIDIDARSILKSNISSSQFSGVGFSAGIDSLSSLSLLEKNPATKPSHLVTLNVGAMGMGEISRDILKKYATRLKNFADSFGYSALVIDSNLGEFYEGTTFQSTHTIRTASAILSLGNAFKDYYYSSGYTYENIGVKPTHDMCISDPILLPLLSTENIQFHAIGTHLSRLEKVRLVCNFGASFNVLDVCVSEPAERVIRLKPNCSNCFKCQRQLISLDLLGELDKFETVFDLESYFENRRDSMYFLMMRALEGDNKSDADVVILAQKVNRLKNFNFNKAVKISNMSWKIRNLIARLVAKDFSSRA